jgi:peptidoglycan/LPS O-acetylase OafA/YrhL
MATLQTGINSNRYELLDGIRGLAAMEVFLSHLRTLFFKNYKSNDFGILKSGFYYLTGFSHESVIIFFVLSGFFISRNIVMTVENGKWTWLGYFIDRFVRLWIVLIPGLLITLILDRAGIHLFPLSSAYRGEIEFIGDGAPVSNLGMDVLLGNVFFLQGILVHTFGSNDPLWSLTNEFWYYVLFPILYFIVISKELKAKLSLSVIAIIVFIFIGKSISIYFLVWLIGYIVYLLQRHYPLPDKFKKMVMILAVIGFGLVLNVNRFLKGMDINKDFLMAISSGALIYCLVGRNLVNGMHKRGLGFISNMSYTIYVIHMPLCLFLSSWLILKPVNLNLRNFAYFTATAISILIVSFLFWVLFESRYRTVRIYFRRVLKVSS